MEIAAGVVGVVLFVVLGLLSGIAAYVIARGDR